MRCKYCSRSCIRKGLRNKVQQYYCTWCRKYQRGDYTRMTITDEQKQMLVQLNNEGLGIRSISRIVNIPASSVVWHIKAIASKCATPLVRETNEIYEIDEILTYVGKNAPVIISGLRTPSIEEQRK